MNLNDLAKAAGENAKAHGFWDPEPGIPARLMLIVSEASELLEHHRDGEEPAELFFLDEDGGRLAGTHELVGSEAVPNKPDGIPAELADMIIRCLDFASRYGIDIDRAVRLKMAYNATRPFKHGRTL